MNPIVGIGELLWDVYPDGRKVAGGAPFNFAFHCHQLGHPAVIVSRVGDDDLGRELREEVRRLGLSDDFIQTDREHPTGTVKVTLDEHKVPTYTITEDVAWDYIAWDEPTAKLIYRAAALCFGSLAKRRPTSRQTIDLLRWNVYGYLDHQFEEVPWAEDDHEAALVVFDVNLRPPFFDRDTLGESFRNTRWVKVNAEEYGVLADLFDLPRDRIDLEELAHLGPVAADTVVFSRGSDGCAVRQLRMAADDGDWVQQVQFVNEQGVPARVVDTVGAGDAFTAAMVCLHLEGRPLRECARFANHYAARVCEHQGATPRIDRAEVERAAFGSP